MCHNYVKVAHVICARNIRMVSEHHYYIFGFHATLMIFLIERSLVIVVIQSSVHQYFHELFHLRVVVKQP